MNETPHVAQLMVFHSMKVWLNLGPRSSIPLYKRKSMILIQRFKQNLETMFLLSPILWSWGVVFSFPDTKHVLSRLMAIVSAYCLIRYKSQIWKIKFECKEYKIFIVFIFLIASFYTFLHYYNDGHFDFARVLWAMFFYYLLIPRHIFTKRNLIVLLLFSSCILSFVAYYQMYFLHIGRVGYIVNSGPFAYVVGLLLIVSMSIAHVEMKNGKFVLFFLLITSSLSLTALLILSQTRTAWLAMFIVVLLQIFRLFRYGNIKSIIAIVVGLGLTMFLVKDLPMIKERVTYAESELVRIQNGNYNSSFGSRLDMWRNGISIYKLAPFIGGNAAEESAAISSSKEKGTIQYHAFYVLNQERPNYHNVIIQALVKGGIIGGVFAIFWCLQFCLLKNAQQKFIQTSYPLLTVFTLVSSQLESQFTIYSATAYFYVFIVGFFLILRVNERSR